MSKRPTPLFEGDDYKTPKALSGGSCSPEEYRERIKGEEEEIKQEGLGWLGAIGGVTIALVFSAAMDIVNHSTEKKAQQTPPAASQGAQHVQPDRDPHP